MDCSAPQIRNERFEPFRALETLETACKPLQELFEVFPVLFRTRYPVSNSYIGHVSHLRSIHLRSTISKQYL